MGAFAAWPLLLTLAAGPERVAVEPGGPRPGGDIGAEDARYLEWLVEDFLFDPKHAIYVRVPVPDRSVMANWPGLGDVLVDRFDRGEDRDGWLVRGTNGNPDRVYFTDGESVAVPAVRTRRLDFEAMCVDRYEPGRRVRRADRIRASDLVLAAWLHRRGYDRLAGAALAAARDTDDDPRMALRVDLARRAADACVRAFADRADTEAMSHAARLFALYPDLAGDHGGQAAGIAADITRRHRAGLGSREPPSKPPAGFDTWPVADQVAFLVRSLDQIDMGDARNFELDVYGRPTSDWRIVALERLGDAAVPALIDAAERDHRLTRWREQVVALGCCGKGGRQPDRVFAVSEVARNTLRRILRVRFLDPTADPEADEDTSDAADIARLRRYWARYGRLAFPDRMMATLTNPAAQPAARREAATTLVDSFSESDSSWSREPRRAVGPRPLVARYSGPTVADAILAAMDRELTNMADPRPDRWERVEDEYVRALTELGDVRVAAELARRAGAATSAGSRLRLARAAHDLGVGGPLVAFTREVAAGTLHFPLPPDQDAATTAIRDLVAALIDCQAPEADAALDALADPGHPYFPVMALGVLGDPDDRGRGGIWNRHPFCLTVLRHLLADQRPTGGHAYRRGNEVEELGPGKPRRFTPPGGADPARWVEHIERTVADDAADRLAELTVGLPEYHPLRRDADQVRADARAVLGKYVGRFRPITWSERSRWEMGYPGDVGYAPDVKPLGRPATAADVAAGRAVFHLNGSGKLADLKLPAWVVLKEGHAERDRPVCGLAVQAEVGPDGAVIYGAIFRHAIRTVKASEVERVEAETRD